MIPQIHPVQSVALMPSEIVMLAYRDDTLSQAEFEAIVRDVYGDFPEEETPYADHQ